MSDQWLGLRTSDIYKDWNLGKLSGMFLMGGVVDNTPLEEWILQRLGEFPEGYKKRVSLSAVNIETGEYTEFNQNNMDFKELAFAAKSSGSIPFVFPPHKWIKRGTFMDGGTVWNVNSVAGVEQCREVVNDDSDIIMDVYMIGAPYEYPPEADNDEHTFENYMRQRELKKYYLDTDQII